MSTNTNLQETKLRTRKALSVSAETRNFPRGTFIWGKMNQSFWPGIIISPNDLETNEVDTKCCIFWFGDHRISHLSKNDITLFASNFSKYYKSRKIQAWREAIAECVTHYGFPLTAYMDYSSLIKFAYSNQIHKIDTTSHIEDIPEFIKIEINSWKLQQKVHKDILNKTKRYNEIQFYLPHVIKNTCVGCLDNITNDYASHPLFDANICLKCAKKLKETLFQTSDDGYEYCFICGNAQQFQCKNVECEVAYCNFCAKIYWTDKIGLSVAWCNLCSSMLDGLISYDSQYILKSARFMLKEEKNTFPPIFTRKTLAFQNISKNIKVLSLFYGISTGVEVTFPVPANVVLALHCNNLLQNYQKQLNHNEIRNFQQLYNSKLIQLVTLTTFPYNINTTELHIDSVDRMKCKEINEDNKMLLILGGTNILKTKIQRFPPKNFYALFVEFWRILTVFKEESNRNVWWMYEMPFTLDIDELNFINRYLQEKPKIICSMGQYCYLWTNISSNKV